MKYKLAFTASLALLAGAIAIAADRPAKIAPPPMFETNMEMMISAGTPGEPHQFLNYFVGEWDVAVTLTRPGSPAVKAQATASVEWVLDNHFLKEEIHGEIMGGKISALSYLGYDNFKNRYTSTWMDSMSTSTSTSSGYQSLGGEEITLFGTIDEPHLNLHDRSVMYVYRSESKDRWVYELHDLHIPEPQTKMMSMVYTRK